MARWLVKLEGDSFDTEEFPHWFPSGPMFSTTDAEGTYLTGSLLDDCSDAAVVHQIADAALDEMYAVICLLDPVVRRPIIGVVLREDDAGRRTGIVYASATIGGRSKLRGTLSAAVTEDAPPRETQAQALLKVAQSSRHLRIALSLLAMPHVSWPHLYRALEEIEVSLGKKGNEAGICTNRERERFKRSANSGEIAGRDARHRVGKFDPPPQPMTLQEAQILVRSCLDITLRRVASTL